MNRKILKIVIFCPNTWIKKSFMALNEFLYYKMGIVLKEAEILGEKKPKMMNRKYIGYKTITR